MDLKEKLREMREIWVSDNHTRDFFSEYDNDMLAAVFTVLLHEIARSNVVGREAERVRQKASEIITVVWGIEGHLPSDVLAGYLHLYDQLGDEKMIDLFEKAIGNETNAVMN